MSRHRYKMKVCSMWMRISFLLGLLLLDCSWGQEIVLINRGINISLKEAVRNGVPCEKCPARLGVIRTSCPSVERVSSRYGRQTLIISASDFIAGEGITPLGGNRFRMTQDQDCMYGVYTKYSETELLAAKVSSKGAKALYMNERGFYLSLVLDLSCGNLKTAEEIADEQAENARYQEALARQERIRQARIDAAREKEAAERREKWLAKYPVPYPASTPKTPEGPSEKGFFRWLFGL